MHSVSVYRGSVSIFVWEQLCNFIHVEIGKKGENEERFAKEGSFRERNFSKLQMSIKLLYFSYIRCYKPTSNNDEKLIGLVLQIVGLVWSRSFIHFVYFRFRCWVCYWLYSRVKSPKLHRLCLSSCAISIKWFKVKSAIEIDLIPVDDYGNTINWLLTFFSIFHQTQVIGKNRILQ